MANKRGLGMVGLGILLYFICCLVAVLVLSSAVGFLLLLLKIFTLKVFFIFVGAVAAIFIAIWLFIVGGITVRQ